MADYPQFEIGGCSVDIIYAQTKFIVPVAITLAFGFLSIRLSDTTVLDYIRYAAKYFLLTQQKFIWKEKHNEKR